MIIRKIKRVIDGDTFEIDRKINGISRIRIKRLPENKISNL